MRLSIAKGSGAYLVGSAVALALAGRAREARGDERPTLVSDAFYVGGRAEPGWALALGWDVDFYPTADRAVSLGPGLSVTALSNDPPSARRQLVAVTVDALRLKVGLNHPGGLFRPFALAGAGLMWARFSERVAAGSEPVDERFTPVVTLGAGADVWGRGRFGVTTLLLGRLNTGATDRLPTAWLELAIGIRVGL